jgi:AAA family ATP:ADP antiporter
MTNKYFQLVDNFKVFYKPILLGALFSCLMFNYHVLHDLKDTLVVTAAYSGAEVLPVLKFFFVLPASFLFVLFYTKYSTQMNFKHFFYGMIGSFLIFFLFFAFYLHPSFQLSESFCARVESFIEVFPSVKWIVSAIIHWPISLFYVFSEMWGIIFLSFFFWALANEVCSLNEAKRFYPLIIFIAHLSILLSGAAVYFFSKTPLLGRLDMQSITFSLILVVTFVGLLACYLFSKVNKVYLPEKEVILEVKTSKLSLKESFRYIFSSKQLRFLLILVVSYSLCSNLVEVNWKALVKEVTPSPEAYSAYMGRYSFWLGIGATVLALVIGLTNQFFSWKLNALMTPIVCGVLGVVYFVFFFISRFHPEWLSPWILQPLQFTALIGFCQSLLSRSLKYTYFDISKEMVFISLPTDLKKQGKAAVDVAGSRLGKSGSSALQNALLMLTAGSQFTIAPATSFLFVLFLVFWFFSVFRLSNLIKKTTTEEKKTKFDENLSLKHSH